MQETNNDLHQSYEKISQDKKKEKIMKNGI